MDRNGRMYIDLYGSNYLLYKERHFLKKQCRGPARFSIAPSNYRSLIYVWIHCLLQKTNVKYRKNNLRLKEHRRMCITTAFRRRRGTDLKAIDSVSADRYRRLGANYCNYERVIYIFGVVGVGGGGIYLFCQAESVKAGRYPDRSR